MNNNLFWYDAVSKACELLEIDRPISLLVGKYIRNTWGTCPIEAAVRDFDFDEIPGGVGSLEYLVLKRALVNQGKSEKLTKEKAIRILVQETIHERNLILREQMTNIEGEITFLKDIYASVNNGTNC